jgi:tRNA(adenine34) deaminase
VTVRRRGVVSERVINTARAAAQARVAQVVFGADDPKAGAVGSLWDVLRDPRAPHRPQVHRGLLAGESAALLQEFFAGRRL